MTVSRFSPRVIKALAATGLDVKLEIRAAKSDSPTEILIYDAIGEDGWGGGISARDFTLALATAGGGPVHIRLNSPGGNVFDGLAIYNALLAHPGEVTVYVDGLAASAASLIACGGSKIVMAEASMMMIHNAATITWGDANAMKATAGVLEKIDGQIAGIYAKRSGADASSFRPQMDAETWFTAQEAVDAGLATEIAEAPKKTVSAKLPAAFTAMAAGREQRIRQLRLAEID